STAVGTLIVFFVVLLSPWPQFISDLANVMLAIPEAADDAIFQNVVKVSTVLITYLPFPAFGGAIGYIVGILLVRKYE
ncbi:hypothetical protein ACFLW5_01680, partial [Chloroflexota bacterium]